MSDSLFSSVTMLLSVTEPVTSLSSTLTHGSKKQEPSLASICYLPCHPRVNYFPCGTRPKAERGSAGIRPERRWWAPRGGWEAGGVRLRRPDFC